MRQHPEIRVSGESFVLLTEDGQSGPHNFADLVYQGRQGSADVYGQKDRDGWRLGLEGPVPEEIAQRLPPKEHYGGWVDKIGLGRAAVLFTIISAGVLFVGMRAPEIVAPLVPASWEKNIGDTMVGDFGGRFCSTPAGSAALAKMTAALDDSPENLRVEVANIDMVNAAALPGGTIILFHGLIVEAKSADEVAGVLGHEMGHVRERHVMQSLLRQMGLSVLLGGMNGSMGETANTVLSMGYGREAEREADRYSIKAMNSANISPAATAEQFGRWSKKEEKLLGKEDDTSFSGYLSTHPMSSKRRDAFAKAVKKGKNYQPVLTPTEWKALKNMCDEDEDVAPDDDFPF